MPQEETPNAGRLTGPALFVVACAACLVFAGGIISRPVEDLVGFVSDDAFYYFQTARNLAATGRPAFDGIHATNGYHPAWMAVCTLLAAVFDDRETLLRAALWTSFLLHLASAWMLVRLCGRFVSKFWAWVLGAAWAVNPLPVTLAMQGVEAPLALLALVWVLDVVVGRYVRDEAPATRDHMRLGVALGCLFLARTDGAIAAVVTLAAVAFLLRRGPWVRALLVAGGTFAAFVVAWIAWSLATVGAVQQDSAAVKMLWASAGTGGEAQVTRAAAAWTFVGGRWLGLPASLLTSWPGVAGPVTAAAFLAFVTFSASRAARRREARGLVVLTSVLAATTALLGIAYGALLTDQMVWYFGPPGLAIFLLATLWAAHHLARIESLKRPAARVACGAALVVGALFVLSRWRERMPFEYPWQRDVLASQREFDAIVAPDARIGCFNAGIPAYFGDHTVVNLDGLVNHDLVDIYRRGEFDRWLADAQIAFIADEPLALGRAEKLTKRPLPLTPVSSAPLRGWLSPTRFLWKVEAR